MLRTLLYCTLLLGVTASHNNATRELIATLVSLHNEVCAIVDRIPPFFLPSDTIVASNDTFTIKSIDTAQGDNATSCFLDNGDEGTCVNHNLCSANETYNNEDRTNNLPCPSYLEACCSSSDIRKLEDVIIPPKDQGCGVRNKDGIGSNKFRPDHGVAEYGEFPWVVAVLKTIKKDDPTSAVEQKYLSGGSLIHPRVVLNTAHHVATVDAKELVLRAGEWDTQTTSELFPHQEREVSEVVVHEEFDKKNLNFDAALLITKTPFELGPTVGVVCLPPPLSLTRSGTKCFSTGWGKEKFGREGLYQVLLRKVEVPTVSHSDCQDELRKTRLGQCFKLHSSFMCAGAKSVDTCSEDGGSPLVCPMEKNPERYTQAGIVAWGISCVADRVPAVYVSVASVREWIDSKIIGHGFDPQVYTY